MAEISPTDWQKHPEARSVHIAGPNYEKLFAEAKSDREQAAALPELRGIPEPHHLLPIENDPAAQLIKDKFKPVEREIELEDTLRELGKLIEEQPSFRLENHWDKVRDMEIELERLQTERREAWRQELRPVLESRVDELARLPFINARSYQADLARHPRISVIQPVHLDRVIFVGRFGTDWSGRTAEHLKRAEGGRQQGKNLPSSEYILETALDIATGELDPEQQERDRLECDPVKLPNGELGFVVNGGAHRVAALKLLGRQMANFRVTWPA